MTLVENRSEDGAGLGPPPGLPAFAAFAVSHRTEPIPDISVDERHLLTETMVASRREGFARGRAAAHNALESIGLDFGPVLSGPHREPVWPRGAAGSISHAAGSAVALVASSASTDGVGVDLEQVRHVPELWDEVPLPEERAWIEATESAQRDAAIVALFSAKESVFKAFFPRYGSFFGFESASMSLSPSGFICHMSDGFDVEYPAERTFPVTCSRFGDLVLTSVVLPKTPIRSSTGRL